MQFSELGHSKWNSLQILCVDDGENPIKSYTPAQCVKIGRHRGTQNWEGKRSNEGVVAKEPQSQCMNVERKLLLHNRAQVSAKVSFVSR